MYVTVPGSPVTETVYASGTGPTVAIEASSVEPNGSTIYRTVRATQVISVVQVSGTAKAYTGVGASGWNATTFDPLKGASTGLASAKSVVASASSTGLRLKARDHADTVVVTMDGELVSWVNSYDGSVTTTSASLAATCESTLFTLCDTILIMTSSVLGRSVSVGR